MKAVAALLKCEGKRQAEIGTLLGVAQQTVTRWLGGHNTRAGNVSTPVPDSRALWRFGRTDGSLTR